MGFCPEAASCKANNNQIIAYQPVFIPRYCKPCERTRISAIWEVYQIYASEIDAQACQESWPQERFREALRRNHDAERKEIEGFLQRLEDLEIQDDIRFHSRRRPGELLSDDEEITAEDSSEEERQALDEDSASDTPDEEPSRHFERDKPGFSDPDDEGEDESSEEEVSALPHFGFDRSILPGHWAPRLGPPRRRQVSDEGWCSACGCYHVSDGENSSDDDGQSSDSDIDGTSIVEQIPFQFDVKTQIVEVCRELDASLIAEGGVEDAKEGEDADIEDNAED